MVAHSKPTAPQNWCAGSYQLVFPDARPPFTCPRCGATVGVRSAETGSTALAFHAAAQKPARGAPRSPGTCEVCECTDLSPCTLDDGTGCSWADVGRTLCSVCLQLVYVLVDAVEAAPARRRTEQELIAAVERSGDERALGRAPNAIAALVERGTLQRHAEGLVPGPRLDRRRVTREARSKA